MTEKSKNNMLATTKKVSGVILAGGQGRRMGGEDKGLVLFKGRALVSYAIDLLKPMVAETLISANRHGDVYAKLGFSVIADNNQEFDGPLQGMLSGLMAARFPWLIVIPCDSPVLNPEVLQRLLEHSEISEAKAFVAHDGQRLQPVIALIHRDLRDDLARFLASGERKLERWFTQVDARVVDCSEYSESFINLNTLEQLTALAQIK